jgi:hypothetical protein
LRVNLRVCNQLRSGHSAHRAITGPQRPNGEPSLARRLTITSAPLISSLARRPDGRFRLPSAGAGGGKSGLHGSTVPGNARRGRPQGQCHREETAGARERFRPPARVKRCGKSAPHPRQRGRHGKPHREQDQIGAARGLRLPAGFRAAARVGRARRRATGVPEEWPSLPHKGRTEPGLQAVWRFSCQIPEVRRQKGTGTTRVLSGPLRISRLLLEFSSNRYFGVALPAEYFF